MRKMWKENPSALVTYRLAVGWTVFCYSVGWLLCWLAMS